jgi:hypothetical protein
VLEFPLEHVGYGGPVVRLQKGKIKKKETCIERCTAVRKVYVHSAMRMVLEEEIRRKKGQEEERKAGRSILDEQAGFSLKIR